MLRGVSRQRRLSGNPADGVDRRRKRRVATQRPQVDDRELLENKDTRLMVRVEGLTHHNTRVVDRRGLAVPPQRAQIRPLPVSPEERV